MPPIVIPQLGPTSRVSYAPTEFDGRLAVWFWTYAVPARAVKVREDLRASTSLQRPDPARFTRPGY